MEEIHPLGRAVERFDRELRDLVPVRPREVPVCVLMLGGGVDVGGFFAGDGEREVGARSVHGLRCAWRAACCPGTYDSGEANDSPPSYEYECACCWDESSDHALPSVAIAPKPWRRMVRDGLRLVRPSFRASVVTERSIVVGAGSVSALLQGTE